VAAAAGDVIKWDSGPQANVVSVTNANAIVVDVSQTVAAGTFVIWKTSQTGLQTEVQRSNTYLTGTGNCGSSWASNVLSMKRTIDFATETGGGHTYTEVGVSPTTTANTSTFCRILLGSAITVAAGQRLRLIYQLNLTIGPSTANAKTAAISGWPVSPATDTTGNEQIQNNGTISTVVTAGYTDTSGGLGLEPCDTGSSGIWISNSSNALAAFGAQNDRSAGYYNNLSTSITKAAYTSGNYYCDKTTVFDVTQANSTTLRSMGIGGYVASMGTLPNSLQALTFLFNQNQSKTNTQTLSLTFRFAWSRTLA
jgi:hypothetical protein